MGFSLLQAGADAGVVAGEWSGAVYAAMRNEWRRGCGCRGVPRLVVEVRRGLLFDRSRREAALLQMKPIAQKHCFVECKLRLRTRLEQLSYRKQC